MRREEGGVKRKEELKGEEDEVVRGSRKEELEGE